MSGDKWTCPEVPETCTMPGADDDILMKSVLISMMSVVRSSDLGQRGVHEKIPSGIPL